MPRYQIIFCIVFNLIGLSLNSQTLVGVDNSTVQIAPSYTINNGTPFSVTGSIKNTGVISITNNVHVHLAIDTSSTSTPKYYLRSTHTYSVTNFLPTQTFTFDVSDVADNANSYKINGNGTTVVIWGVVGFPTNDTTTFDSVKTTIYVLPLPQNINEIGEFNNELDKIPNPITQPVQFTNTQNWIIELVDLNGKITEIKNSKLNPINHVTGAYLLRFRDSTGIEFNKKIIIQRFD